MPQKLEEFNRVSDFDCYLLYIFKHLNDANASRQRVQAGILLKNNIIDHWADRIDPVRRYVRAEVVSVLGDPDERVRSTAGSIVATILRAEGIKSWPDGVAHLGELLGSTSDSVVDGALSALLMIFQDHVEALGSTDLAQLLLSLLNKLFSFLSHQNAKFRNIAMDCFSTLLEFPPAVLRDNASHLLEVHAARAGNARLY